MVGDRRRGADMPSARNLMALYSRRPSISRVGAKLCRDWRQNGAPAEAGARKADPKGPWRARFTFAPARQGLKWCGGRAKERLQRRSASKTRMGPMEGVVRERPGEAPFKISEIEGRYEPNLGDPFQRLPETPSRAVARMLSAEANRCLTPRRLTVCVKTPAMNSPPRSVIRYLGRPKAEAATSNSRAMHELGPSRAAGHVLTSPCPSQGTSADKLRS